MRRPLAIPVVVLCIAAALTSGVRAEHKSLKTGAFEVTHTLVLAGAPEEVFDAITGDVSAWWDHSFSGHPYAFYIEPKAGGGFWEIFDDEGNGVRHAEVTAAVRGELLRFEGPLGLAGNAIHMVHTYQFTALDGGKTELKLTVRAAGQVEDGWAEAVDGVWRHFLFERFQPYYESGAYKDR